MEASKVVAGRWYRLQGKYGPPLRAIERVEWSAEVWEMVGLGGSLKIHEHRLLTWVPNPGDWVRHPRFPDHPPLVVSRVTEVRLVDVSTALVAHLASEEGGPVRVECIVRELEPCLPPEREPLPPETDETYRLPPERDDRLPPERDERLPGEPILPRVRPFSGEERQCPKCHGDTYAGLLGREHACPEVTYPAPQVEKVEHRHEVVWRAFADWTRAVAIHPIREEAIRLWEAMVRGG